MSTKTQASDILDSLQWRYATKRFDPARPVSPEDWGTLKEALALSASSYGLQPYRFILPENPAVRARLREAARGQAQVTDASHLVVFAARDRITLKDVEDYVARVAHTRDQPLEAFGGMRNTIVSDLVEGPRAPVAGHWAARQAYLALGNLLTTAALLGIDACPMEGFSPAEFDRILGLEGTGYHTVCMCALGYRSPEDAYAKATKFRYPAEELFILK
nr:NAD(P)H-dependent oxidoreductase [uncultured Holophaga sp.]